MRFLLLPPEDILVFTLFVFYLPLLFVAVPLVETALKRWLRSESSRTRLVLRCVIRGAAYSPVTIGFAHGLISLPLVLALPFFMIAELVEFYAIPFATLTLFFLMISYFRSGMMAKESSKA